MQSANSARKPLCIKADEYNKEADEEGEDKEENETPRQWRQSRCIRDAHRTTVFIVHAPLRRESAFPLTIPHRNYYRLH